MINLDAMTIEERTAYRVLRARSALIDERRFYGVLVSNVEPVISRQVETAATDAKRHYWNPEYVEGLPQDELEGVQAHESEHDARHHGTRRGNRDPGRWNEACDKAINPDLIRQGFKLPKNILLDWRFEGWAAEDIYRTLELERQEAEQPEPPQAGEGEDEPEQGNEQADTDPGQDEGEDEAQGDGEGDEGQGEGEGEDGPGEPGEAAGEADGDEGTEGQGGQETAQEASQGQGEGQGPLKGASGDCGGCGEVLDAAKDAGDNAEQDIRWERIVRQAASMAKSVGQLPGHVSRDIERANNPPQDWREVLRAWFDQGSLFSESWNQPNRRFVGSGLYLPGRHKDGINKVAFLVDTSGSMDRIALACVRNEAQAALDDGVIDEVVVVYGDVTVTRVDQYRTGDEIDFDPRGGGGTDLRPLFAHIAEQHDDVSLICAFSDMEIGEPGPEPACPVLWCATGYPHRVREHMANSPWGAAMIDVGEH